MNLDELERLRAVAEQQLGSRELGSTYLYETDVDAYMTALRNHAEELIRDARRYRWLVDLAEFPSPGGWVCADDSVEDKGKWIDAAIAQEGKG